MILKKIKIKNFKAIDNMEVDFTPGVNLLIGDNGAGKTSLLESLTVAIGGFFYGITGVSSKGIIQEDVRFITHRISAASYSIEYLTPTEINSEFEIGNKNYSCKIHRNDQTGVSRTRTSAKELAEYANKITNDINSMLPVFCYRSIQKGQGQSKRSDFGSKTKNKLNDRRCGYIGCLDSRLDMSEVKQWCLNMELAEFKKMSKIPEYEAFKDTIASFMQKMNELSEKPVIEYSRDFDDMAYTENGETVPVSYLSAGYQSLLYMIMDIAFRLAVLNPTQNSFENATGIILIDELDMHLHPKWQWNAIAALENTFPKIQFIIATHSPIIISSCKNENLILLEKDCEVNYLESAYAFSVEDVIELRQGSSSIPKELAEMYNKFESLLNAEKYDEAKVVLQQMKNKFGEDNSEVKNAEWELNMGEI